MNKTVRSIRFIFLLNFAWSFLVIQAIMVPFYSSKGLSAQQIISIATIFSVTLLLLDVPTGYLADMFSRRAALIAAGLFKGLGGTVLLAWQTYPGFIAAFVLIGIGNSLFSGADLALLSQLNSSRGTKAESMSDLLSARLSMGLLGAALSAILGGFIANYSFQTALLLNCIVAWSSFGIAWFIAEPKFQTSEFQTSTVKPPLEFSSFLRTLFISKGELRFLFFTRIGLLTILQLHAAVLQILWQFLKVPLFWFGFLAATHALLGAGLAQLLARKKIRFSFRLAIYLVAGLPVLGFFGSAFGTWSMVVSLGSGLLFELYRALVSSQMNALFNNCLPSHLLATGNSFASMGSRLAFVAISPVVGIGIDQLGVLTTFLALGAASVLFAIVPLQMLAPNVLYFGGRPKPRTEII